MFEIRDETPDDAAAIGAMTAAAFEGMRHSRGTEPAIVAALRAAGALSVSLVAVEAGEILGHVAFSAVEIPGAGPGWYGVGPLSVRPDRQRAGIGTALMEAGLSRIRAAGAVGCVLVGDLGYYSRFGFARRGGLTYSDVPDVYVLGLAFHGAMPGGEIAFHPGFLAE
jgi:putative acetyltransferase